MSATAASFRHRLQRQHNHHQLHHIQTQNIPPPAPWSSEAYTAPPTTNRPPLSPRGYSSAAATTGQSRFVEGSMNDRVSAAPPPGFLGFGEEGGEEGEGEGEGEGGDGEGIGMGIDQRLGQGRRSPERQIRYQESRPLRQQQYRMSEPVSAGVGGYGYGGEEGTTSGRYHLRRPRSTAGWVTTQAVPPPPQQQAAQRGGVVKKTSFLAPLWDGVREKLHLNKSKSSGSIGRVVNSVVGERKVERERERERVAPPVVAVADGGEERDTVPPIQSPSTAHYPSREEVLESYKNLVASGFFEQHAIRGGRHPLRTGGNGPAQEQGKSFADHMASPGTMHSPGGRSFSEHMAAPGTPVSPSGKSFADHMAAQQQRPGPPLSSPIRHSMGPPPPPRGSSQGKSDTIPSPQRGTKRGASLDFAGDAEMVTRKLVKKLRHSASRISVELTGGRENYHYSHGTARSRPSTSSNRPGPLSPTSSVFSGITSPRSSIADDTASIRPSKLTKPKDGRRRRILGITRRHRSPAPAAAAEAEADPDAMMIDEPEQQRQPEPPTTEQLPKIHRITTPPPASFRTSYPRNSLRGSSTTRTLESVQQNEPLSIVPDANQGIPFVPRIPREFCDAMASMAPSAAAVVVGVSGEVKEEEAKAKNGNRDSGLGEDVENIPVFG